MTNPFQRHVNSLPDTLPTAGQCKHHGWRVVHVHGQNAGRVLVCLDCQSILGIKPDIRPEDIQVVERIVYKYIDRPAKHTEAMAVFMVVVTIMAFAFGMIVMGLGT